MIEETNFYTLKGYSLLEHNQITASMEDYLEMICRCHLSGDSPVRIKQLSELLHVKPSSASKMVNNLCLNGLVNFEKYGHITLTDAGLELGKYLLFRHKVLHSFFCYINGTSDELELVEKIEHFIDEKTVRNINKFLNRLSADYPEL